MKAIINVKTPSFYSQYNFKTFEVEEIGNSWVSIKGLNPEFTENKTDFSFNEVYIVDIEIELKFERQSAERYKCETSRKKAEALEKYCKFRKLKI